MSHLISEKPVIIVVMGVSGTGKSTLGKALAARLGVPFVDGDDLHPPSNVEKMTRGQPLTDVDREPWLQLIRNTAEKIARAEMREQKQKDDGTGPDGRRLLAKGVVIGCSALKKYYREILRGRWTGGGQHASESREDELRPQDFSTYFVFIEGSRELLMERMEKRNGHFMKASMLDSQMATLESPAGEEGTIVLSAMQSTEEQVGIALDGLKGV